MPDDPDRDDYYRLHSVSVRGRPLRLKQGVRGHPDLAPGADLLLSGLELDPGSTVIDASGSAGAVALAAEPQPAAWTVLEPSAAALRCARATFADHPAVRVDAGLIWDRAGAETDAVCLLPPADKGGARVEAELTGACLALRSGGRAWLAFHRDRGAKRYERLAADLFGAAEVIARSRGWRLTRATRSRTPEPVPWLAFEAAGLRLRSLPGVFAAGKLDPGTAALLAAIDLPALRGRRVLDLGCGYGPIALSAARHGAHVTALDDDLAAVRSTDHNAAELGLDIVVRHSDVTAALDPDDRFDTVLVNPPFHVGSGVRLALPRVFIAGAFAHLHRGGEIVLVANRALPYEREIERFGRVETLADNGRFKVLRGFRSDAIR